MYQVTVENKGQMFWLKRTTWAFHPERGDRFATKEEAEAAIARASKFMAHTIRKNLVIEEIPA